MVKTEIQFGTSGRVLNSQVVAANFDIVSKYKHDAATSLGVEIMKAKGWRQQENFEESAIEFYQNLVVFTPEELQEFVETKIEERQLKEQKG